MFYKSGMYSRQEAILIRQRFWANFGRYMKPVPFAGEKNNWINYKTGVPHIHFRMRAEKDHVYIGIESGEPSGEQMQQFLRLKTLLHSMSGENWTWETGRIYRQLDGVNVMKESDWPALVSFLKAGMIALDAFWDEVKYGFLP